MGQDSALAKMDTKLQPNKMPTVQKAIRPATCNNFTEFFKELPTNIRTNVAEILITGAADLLDIREETFHMYLHCASVCSNSSLLRACACYAHRMSLSETTLDCDGDCRKLLNCELNKLNANICVCPQGCKNSMAVREFLVLFTSPILREHPGSMAIFDIHSSTMFNIRTSKGKGINEGYAVCSYHLENVPYVVISGGNGKSSARLHRHDVVRNKWDMKIDLKINRTGHVMCYCAGQIYLVGGLQTSSIEVCQMNTKKVTNIGSLPVAVHNMAHVVANDKVYIFGGETDRGMVSTVQCIDTKKSEITRLEDLPCECSGGQAICLNNETIYIATHQGHMIKYDIATDTSELCSHQPFCRRNFAMFTKDGCIFILGGVRTDGHAGPPCVLCKYMPQTDHWVKAATFAKYVPIYASCHVQYPKLCPIIPFSSSL